MPGAKTVGVAHSSYRPIPVLRYNSTLVVLCIFLLSLVTVGYFFYPATSYLGRCASLYNMARPSWNRRGQKPPTLLLNDQQILSRPP
jgi:hypothetical protein